MDFQVPDFLIEWMIHNNWVSEHGLPLWPVYKDSHLMIKKCEPVLANNIEGTGNAKLTIELVSINKIVYTNLNLNRLLF